MSRPIEDMRLVQIGFLVKDIKKTRAQFARFFDVPEPEIVNSGEYEVTKTEYRGEPAPKAKCYMTFFYYDCRCGHHCCAAAWTGDGTGKA